MSYLLGMGTSLPFIAVFNEPKINSWEKCITLVGFSKTIQSLWPYVCLSFIRLRQISCQMLRILVSKKLTAFKLFDILDIFVSSNSSPRF